MMEHRVALGHVSDAFDDPALRGVAAAARRTLVDSRRVSKNTPVAEIQTALAAGLDYVRLPPSAHGRIDFTITPAIRVQFERAPDNLGWTVELLLDPMHPLPPEDGDDG